ncbi:MAG: cytochrome c peroxidase [Candidatus Pedobacter colombiensis]|uniref:Cytochrome c peroxidase n=1 Tax=Candidatus Pedobacter colombiensis TaxID=3121371 RepID=A0AAJ6B710_9SPHI|nr:cytochrome c peroxidase [Pedobacter sp.]WEK19414.1 MAG: cytochrome c peroxidase [Pedobacter sp.]
MTSKVISLGFSVMVVVTLLSLRQPDTPAVQVKEKLILQADHFLSAVQLLRATKMNIAQSQLLQRRFREVRLAYKQLEWATEYFDPLTARRVNGPPAPETEFSGLVIQPEGLQVIEEYLFPRFDLNKKKELNGFLDQLVVSATEFREYFRRADLQDWQILDAIKLEIFRIETLGLNDFDDPLSKRCFVESAVALQSLKEVTCHYGNVPEFDPAIFYLQHPVTFDRFDRATFITHYANPLTRSLKVLKDRLKLPDVRYNHLLNQDVATLFDANAFNRNAYTAEPGDSVTAEKIVLGKKLFFDPILSGNRKRSCASCHQPNKAFTDGLVKNLDITGKKMIRRNTPTLINAALQPAQFYDLRAASLEDQASDVVRNRDEMHGDMQTATGKLWLDTNYRKLFNLAYPQQRRKAIDTFEVANALAGYVRSLTALNSRFDTYMQGDKRAMRKTELAGFNLFMGKARCGTCHYLPLFNGVLPPRYMRMEAEVIGVPQKRKGKHIDPDLGLYSIQSGDFNRYAFKTTTVRNTARTAPYMHNGVFQTLEEVIDFYDKGGGRGAGIEIANQTLDAKPLHLTQKDKTELIDFIRSLDSR